MADKRVIKFSMIAAFFKNNTSQLERGENSYTSGNVAKVVFDPSFTPAILKGEVKASMKTRKYNIEIWLDTDDGIVNAKCSCPRGETICHHMAALCIYAHHNISVTDQACAWNAPSISNVEETKTLNEMFPLTKPYYCAFKRQVTSNEINKFKRNLSPYIVGFTWILQKEPEDNFIELVPCIESTIFSAQYIASQNKIDFLTKVCILTEEKIKKIAEATIGQSKNEHWLIVRKHRLTASHFGQVLAASKRNRFPPSLYKGLLESYDLSSLKAIQWGREHEPTALETFELATGMSVSPTGLWLDKCGFLGASPDGFVGNDALIEVKCPFKFKSTSLENALKCDKSYVIEKDENGVTKLNKNHNYYHQIQGQLYLANKKICYLVVWTPAECEIVEVAKEEEWEKNLDILKEFYINNFVPFIASMKV